MEQQQFKVRLSVGTKLLISGVLLLIIVIAFLNFSTIFLLKEDKRAYIYQSQSTEAVLAGREFVNSVRRALDTMRLSLAAIDPRHPVTPAEVAALKAIIENQSEVPHISLFLVDPGKSLMPRITEASNDREIKQLQLTAQELEAPPEAVKDVMQELSKNSYAFLNLSKVGGNPVLGLVMADLKLQANPGGMPIAIGVVSLKEFASELKGLNLAIATRSGRILFDTDPETMYSKKSIKLDTLFMASAASQLETGAQEYDSTDGKRFLGSYVHPGLDLVVINKTEWNKAMKATFALTEKFILLGLMAVGVAIVFTIIFSRSLTAPINRLYQATKEIAKGNFAVSLQSKSRDEIGALTDSFTVMSRQISELISEKMAKVQLEQELAIASTVQQTLIPPPNFQNENFLIQSHYQSANQCGGDWWGFFGVERKMAIMIADATGHGFPSALITASARSCVSMLHKLAQEDPDFSFSPSAMLSFANRVIFDASMSRIMMTFFAGVIDLDTGVLTYANAGHNPPWLFKREGAEFSLKSLTALGQRLGEERDVPPFEEKTAKITTGDILFLYTDGLMEGKNLEGAMYGKKRARKVVETNLAGGPGIVVRNVMNDFLAFNKGKALDDDVTLAALSLLAPGQGHAEA